MLLCIYNASATHQHQIPTLSTSAIHQHYLLTLLLTADNPGYQSYAAHETIGGYIKNVRSVPRIVTFLSKLPELSLPLRIIFSIPAIFLSKLIILSPKSGWPTVNK